MDFTLKETLRVGQSIPEGTWLILKASNRSKEKYKPTILSKPLRSMILLCLKKFRILIIALKMFFFLINLLVLNPYII